MLNVRNESQKYGGEDLVNDFIARSCGVISFEECVAPDISDGIVGNISDNDLVIVGAPNSWQLSKWFSNSIPYKIFTNSDSTIMLNAPKAKRVHIRDAVWHELVNLQLEAPDKKDAIRQLVQLLINSNQIVEEQKDDILKLFLKREEICSTGVGQETAFPHITLPGFSGLLCCLGVCPQGVSFAEDGNKDTKFIFLTISSPDYCSEYLDFLSQVARRMVNKNTRCRLLNAKNVNDALNILQPIII
jgi:mannitol/fructose-specific phosphotransferase system IIA component (Ntr-type)